MSSPTRRTCCPGKAAVRSSTRPGAGWWTCSIITTASVRSGRGPPVLTNHQRSLPGGWCDVGYTPTEVAEKEAFEEAGIRVKAGRLLAVFDKKCHDHPEDLYYAYKELLQEAEQGLMPWSHAVKVKEIIWDPISDSPNWERVAKTIKESYTHTN